MVMLVSASVLMICCGVVCLRDTDLAWRLYEWDCRMMGMTPPRIHNWRLRVRQVGGLLIAFGLVALRVSLTL